MANIKEKKTLLEKLQEARNHVKSTKHKKDGRNDYSKFDYFTPVTVDAIVTEACAETKVIPVCNLMRNEFGPYQEMKLYNLEDTKEEPLIFHLATAQSAMTATNEAQQWGGTDTYSERYIKMKVFEIKDNNLDPDSKDNSVKKNAPVKTAEDLDF